MIGSKRDSNMAKAFRYFICGVVLLLGVVLSLVQGGLVDICNFEYGAIHYGRIKLGDEHILGKLDGMRSKVECATYCYAKATCLTAVYQESGTCLLIGNFFDNLTTSSANGGDADTLIELRTSALKVVGADHSMVAPVCTSSCTGYAVCLLDCTYDGIGESMCMDMTDNQYTTDRCEFQPHIQSKEYYLANLDRDSNVDGYAFFTITFVKLYAWTTLQVRWRGTLRGGYGAGVTSGTWGRWRILFNGLDCEDPGWIEGVNYNSETDTDHHKASGINGICYGLAAQSWDISLNVAIETSSFFRAGYATLASRMYVDEIGQGTWIEEPSENACPSLSDFNYREHIGMSEWGQEPSVTLWSFGYTKMESETILRINTDIVYRQSSGGNDVLTCATWYIMIDGGHCQPQPHGKTVANSHGANLVSNEHRSTEVEGHCTGVSSGYHTLSLLLDNCPNGDVAINVHTGWNSCRMRVIINEIRLGTNVAAVLAPDGSSLYRLPMFNMEIHGRHHLDSGVDDGDIWTLPAYTKLYESSGIRLSLSSNGRAYNVDSGTYDPCCRHFFKINGAECTNPGTIEGIHYLNKATNLVRPVMIEGICEGVPAGTVTVTVTAGLCKGHSRKGDCAFNWNEYAHIMVAESFVDREIVQF